MQNLAWKLISVFASNSHLFSFWITTLNQFSLNQAAKTRRMLYNYTSFKPSRGEKAPIKGELKHARSHLISFILLFRALIIGEYSSSQQQINQHWRESLRQWDFHLLTFEAEFKRKIRTICRRICQEVPGGSTQKRPTVASSSFLKVFFGIKWAYCSLISYVNLVAIILEPRYVC